MMRIMRGILLATAATIISLSSFNSAEAAKVALLPLVNNVVERDDLSTIYYDRAVEATRNANDAELVDSSELDKAINKYVKMGELPNQENCAAIANEGGVDIVIAVEIDVLDNKPLDAFSDDTKMYMKGRLVSLNLQTGKYINKSIDDDKIVPQMTLARYDGCGDMFGDAVTREVKRILGVKKVTIEKPRISKAGFKGDRR